MFFYVDESGHTGANLFDRNQPVLYYGVLNSRSSLDALAVGEMRRARRCLGVDRLHANEVGLGGLAEISPELTAIEKRFRPQFDIYRVVKRDHAIISFFDQVFDQGMNPAVTWTAYWSPLRFVLLLKLSALFDDDLAKTAWEARIELNDDVAETSLVAICRKLLERVSRVPDDRSRQLIGDALAWAIENPAALNYNCRSKKDVLSITPNVIGFQSVMFGIAARSKGTKRIVSITIDQQSQFNKAQKTLAEFYASNKKQPPIALGLGLPTLDLTNIPDVPLTFRSGEESIGLELVDVYLWVFKRFVEGKELPPELHPFIKPQLPRIKTDDISLSSINERWSNWFRELPEPTEAQMEKARELVEFDENRRLRGMARQRS